MREREACATARGFDDTGRNAGIERADASLRFTSPFSVVSLRLTSVSTPCLRCRFYGLVELQLRQVLVVDQAHGALVGVDHEQIVDAVLLEEFQRLDR